MRLHESVRVNLSLSVSSLMRSVDVAGRVRPWGVRIRMRTKMRMRMKTGRVRSNEKFTLPE